MTGETETIDPALLAFASKAIEKNDIAKIANAVPLPGALKDAFSIAPNIRVDKFEIRPFYDGDFDILVSLNNPLGELLASTMAGQQHKDYFPRGQTAWEICYLFSNPIKQCFDEVESGSFKKHARDAFCEFRLEALVQIHNAVMKQLAIYWSTAIGYESNEEPEEGTVKKK